MIITMNSKSWPKTFPPLTPEQRLISDDFMKYWHEILSARYSIVDAFNHEYVVKNAPKNFLTTIEIGAGNGEHLHYEKLNKAQRQHYHAIDIRENMVSSFRERFPDIQATVADCQIRMPFEDGYADRVLAIHVLEHLPNLPLAIQELYRLCNKSHGICSVVIPCEGSLAYTIARKISAERLFKARYHQSYRWFIEREHINLPYEIFSELDPYFEIISTSYFPIPIPIQMCNLCIGITLKPRSKILS